MLDRRAPFAVTFGSPIILDCRVVGRHVGHVDEREKEAGKLGLGSRWAEKWIFGPDGP